MRLWQSSTSWGSRLGRSDDGAPPGVQTTSRKESTMSDASKVAPTHLRRAAFVYVRQSTQSQLEHNPESRERQYGLVGRALELGWNKEQVVVVDEDLGISGSGMAERSGFARMTAEVALGKVGLILGLEVSRLARNSALFRNRNNADYAAHPVMPRGGRRPSLRAAISRM